MNVPDKKGGNGSKDYDRLCDMLDEKQVAALDMFLQKEGEHHAECEKAFYIQGFKDGVNLIFECFSKDSSYLI